MEGKEKKEEEDDAEVEEKEEEEVDAEVEMPKPLNPIEDQLQSFSQPALQKNFKAKKRPHFLAVKMLQILS